MAQTLYEILGVPRDATFEQINAAYQTKALIMHPDHDKSNIDALRQFRALSQAYQTLMDPQLRREYDASLPHITPPPDAELFAFWQRVIQTYSEESDCLIQVVDAMYEALPLAMDGDQLVLGFEPSKMELSNDFLTSEARVNLSRVISQVTGHQTDFRVIEGTTIAEWEAIKQQESPPPPPPPPPPPVKPKPEPAKPGVEGRTKPVFAKNITPEKLWEEVQETQQHGWLAVSNQSFPQSRARHVLEQISVLSAAEELARANGQPEEAIQRQLVKALERISSQTNIESGVIALEYQRFRLNLQGGTE